MLRCEHYIFTTKGEIQIEMQHFYTSVLKYFGLVDTYTYLITHFLHVCRFKMLMQNELDAILPSLNNLLVGFPWNLKLSVTLASCYLGLHRKRLPK